MALPTTKGQINKEKSTQRNLSMHGTAEMQSTVVLLTSLSKKVWTSFY